MSDYTQKSRFFEVHDQALSKMIEDHCTKRGHIIRAIDKIGKDEKLIFIPMDAFDRPLDGFYYDEGATHAEQYVYFELANRVASDAGGQVGYVFTMESN